MAETLDSKTGLSQYDYQLMQQQWLKPDTGINRNHCLGFLNQLFGISVTKSNTWVFIVQITVFMEVSRMFFDNKF
tara:strand:+ start:1571 stop:1795 length:225 start_codon:yes stop_codon:yes gene_type:complete